MPILQVKQVQDQKQHEKFLFDSCKPNKSATREKHDCNSNSFERK